MCALSDEHVLVPLLHMHLGYWTPHAGVFAHRTGSSISTLSARSASLNMLEYQVTEAQNPIRLRGLGRTRDNYSQNTITSANSRTSPHARRLLPHAPVLRSIAQPSMTAVLTIVLNRSAATSLRRGQANALHSRPEVTTGPSHRPAGGSHGRVSTHEPSPPPPGPARQEGDNLQLTILPVVLK